jgi:serine-type D-Ala-D-Ala carboxypeptidase (penicillin-binding protein 5/6)
MSGRSGPLRTRLKAGLIALLAGVILAPPTGSSAAPSTPPPTPVGPNGSPSPFPTALVTPEPSLAVPTLSAPSVFLEDLDSGQVLYANRGRVRRPVASLTKIMTALVVLSRADPDDTVVASTNAAGQSGSVLGLRAGERIAVRELLYALLLQSSNDAAVALAEHVGGSVAGFLDLMNAQARKLGMTDSFFTSPSGLDDSGYSSARDLAIATRIAYGNPLFERIVKTKFHNVPSPSGAPRRIQNRNILLWLYPATIGVKTGFTTPAGHCLIVAAEDATGLRLMAVALGSPGTDAAGVFNDGAALLNYGYEAFRRETLIHTGDPVGPFQVSGAAVPAVAAATLVHLVRTDELDEVGIQVRMASDLTLPVARGQVVGSVTVTVAGRRVGRVDAVATAMVSGSAPAPLPSVSPALSPLGRLLVLIHGLLQAALEPFL